MSLLIQAECAIHPIERAYAAWLKKLKAVLGENVDPNGLAYDLFVDGATPHAAAAELAARPRRNKGGDHDR